MSNQFDQQPVLDPIILPDEWTCPITGLVVPKDPTANLQWRARMLEAAETDPDLQQDLYTACSQSILFFVNGFCFTVRVNEPAPDGSGKVRQAEHVHLPFVTWPIQDTHFLKLEFGIDEGESLLTDKSRDMGATWDHIATYVHRFIFRHDESHLMISRKEDAVDGMSGPAKNYPFGPLADPGTLFGKIDYILSRLPEWMLPKMNRKKLHLVNLDTNNRIDGESANETAGSSDRRRSVFLDEFAKIDNAESIKRSLAAVTACQLVCSTPNGAGTTYSKWRMSGQIPVFVLPWWEHPEKGAGRYTCPDELGRWRIRSPWYDKRCEEGTPKEIAIELDMDHVGSGDTFFESVAIETHKKLFGRPALNTYSVNWKANTTDDNLKASLRSGGQEHIRKSPAKGPLRLWVALSETGRLDQTFTYTVSCDISKGQGASNSVASIMCDQTREKVAEWADAHTPPFEFARIAMALCVWVGGRHRPLLIWENNGDTGFDFGNQVAYTYGYSHMYFNRQIGTTAEKAGKRYGWRSSAEQKAAALGNLRRTYSHGGFTNHSIEALNEALTYVTYPNGGIGPSAFQEESAEARKTHGDRVIADMLCLVPHAPQLREEKKEPVPTHRTFAGRLAEYQREKKRLASGNYFDFTQA